MAYPANVIPFPRQSARDPVSFTLGARYDLRLGACAAGVVRPQGQEAHGYASLARLLRAARMTWRAESAIGQISLVLDDDALAHWDTEALSDVAAEAGCTHQALTFELNERAVIDGAVDLAERLRGRGWGVALRGDPACPLPFGARARGLYTELVVEAPDPVDPYFALESDNAPLARRLMAAKHAGMVISAENVRTPQQARRLAIAGFDRGSGPFSDLLRKA